MQFELLADASLPPHAVDAQWSRNNREETNSQVVEAPAVVVRGVVELPRDAREAGK